MLQDKGFVCFVDKKKRLFIRNDKKNGRLSQIMLYRQTV